MSDHVYKSVELTGSSATTVDDAIRNAIARASKTLHNLRWFEVMSVRDWLGKIGVKTLYIEPGSPRCRLSVYGIGADPVRGRTAMWRASMGSSEMNF